MSGFRKTTKPTQSVEKQVETVQKVAPKESTSSSGKTYLNGAMTILNKKEGGVYLKINEGRKAGVVKLFAEVNGKMKEVTAIYSKSLEEELEDLVNRNVITEQQAEERFEKQSFIAANITLVVE